MHLLLDLKSKIKIVFFFVFISSLLFGQGGEETRASYNFYRFHPIAMTDIGFSTAPFTMKYKFQNNIQRIHYDHNNKMMIGLGFSHNWFSLRLGAALLGNFKPKHLFGRANYIDIGAQFTVKRVYAEVDLKYYAGYVVRNAFQWDPNYNLKTPNDLSQDIHVRTISAKAWYLHNRDFRMDPFYGNRGNYNKQVMTWYLAGRFEVHGLNNNAGPIVPEVLHDSTNTKTSADALNAVEIGIIPGYGYVTRVKNFQFGFMAAAGPRIQFKNYQVREEKTNLAGVVARYDFKAVFGYNVPRYYVMAHVELDNKSIHFGSFKYNQSYIYFKVQTGWRFNERIPKKLRKE